MDNMIRNAFDKIHAEDALKQKTADFLHERIRQPNDKRKTPRLRLAAVCVSFALLFIIGELSCNLYFTPSTYVDIDVNPSIELVVNRFGKVIEVSPYNDDGAALLKDVNVRHMNYDNAVDTLIGAMVSNGCLKQDGRLSVSIQTNDGDRESSILGSLQSTISNSLQEHHTNAITDVFSVSEEVKTHAHENHVTPAMYLAISELQQLDPTANFKDCRDHTLSEINQMIQEHGGEHHGDKTDDDNKEQGQPPADDCETEENHSNNSAAPSSQSMPRNQHEGDGEHDGRHH